MRVFLSTGEASGDMSAAALAHEIRTLVPDVEICGIGSERLRAAGVELVEETRGWAVIGPIDVIRKIPQLLLVALRNAVRLRRNPVDVIVMTDFSAFHIRFAWILRRLGYRRPIVYFFPPGAWLNNAAQAQYVAAMTLALTPFVHQRDFYHSLGLDVAFFGHPLVSIVQPRVPRDAAPSDGGTIALLPGSRRSEIALHIPLLRATLRALRRTRPRLRCVLAAADADADARLRAELGDDVDEIVRGSREAFDAADVALVASGTAVLEAALREVPTVSMYVISKSLEPIARRVFRKDFRRPYVTLPNLVLEREVIPEFLQDRAIVENLVTAVEGLLRDPQQQRAAFAELRVKLGPPDALAQCARFVVDTARGV
ncbi:MAG TPA: hypothetical protein VGZ00_10045 [Candidatus Baltobacteraceae bacterium]|jgi:lipid-A-disaccharide synthase|nr:hypothetical protein [Candidatus Baltobacteraceae bacterium]